MPARAREEAVQGVWRVGDMPARAGEEAVQGMWRGGDMPARSGEHVFVWSSGGRDVQPRSRMAATAPLGCCCRLSRSSCIAAFMTAHIAEHLSMHMPTQGLCTCLCTDMHHLSPHEQKPADANVCAHIYQSMTLCVSLHACMMRGTFPSSHSSYNNNSFLL